MLTYGNQHRSRKQTLLDLLDYARSQLNWNNLSTAQAALGQWRAGYAQVPASTKRRWRCGR